MISEELQGAIAELAAFTAAAYNIHIPEFGEMLDSAFSQFAKTLGFAEWAAQWVSHDASEKLQLTRWLGCPEKAGADLVNSCVNAGLAIGMSPRILKLTFGVEDGRTAEAYDILECVASACRAGGIVLSPDARLEIVKNSDPWILRGDLGGVCQSGALAGVHAVRRGDGVIGIGSSGLHTTGCTFVMNQMRERGWNPNIINTRAGESLARALAASTKSYYGELLNPMTQRRIRALVPVGGGGLAGALRASTGDKFTIAPDTAAWPEPPLFQSLRELGGMAREQSLQIWNGGIGMLAIVAPEHEQGVFDELGAWNEERWRIGRVAERRGEDAPLD